MRTTSSAYLASPSSSPVPPVDDRLEYQGDPGTYGRRLGLLRRRSILIHVLIHEIRTVGQQKLAADRSERRRLLWRPAVQQRGPADVCTVFIALGLQRNDQCRVAWNQPRDECLGR